MTPLLLALAVAAAAPADPVAHVVAVERLPLPRVEGPIAVHVDAFERRVVVQAPRGAAALARALRGLSRLVCPEVEETPHAVVLRCRSSRIDAAARPGPALELRELAGLHGEGPAAMPIVFHEPTSLGLGSCTEGDPAAHGECLLHAGDPARAEEELRRGVAAGGRSREHALLRLGDLALAAGDPAAAERAWAGVSEAPWLALGGVRRCELSADCVAAKGEKLYAADGLPVSFARELRLRAARVLAYRGQAIAAAWSLAGEWEAPGACAGGQPLCRRIVLAALRDPRGRDEEALALHAAGIRSDQGPFALELAEAASALAARAGAPAFAAATLASAAGRVDDASLPDHLLRTAELYAAAGDAVRGRVVLDFARGRLGAAPLAAPRWRKVAQALAAASRTAPPGASAAPGPDARSGQRGASRGHRGALPPDLEDLSRARAAVARAQALPGVEP